MQSWHKTRENGIEHVPNFDFTGATTGFCGRNQRLKQFPLCRCQITGVSFTHRSQRCCIYVFTAYALRAFLLTIQLFKHPLKSQLVVDPITKAVICTTFGSGKEHDFHLFKRSRVKFKKETQRFGLRFNLIAGLYNYELGFSKAD